MAGAPHPDSSLRRVIVARASQARHCGMPGLHPPNCAETAPPPAASAPGACSGVIAASRPHRPDFAPPLPGSRQVVRVRKLTQATTCGGDLGASAALQGRRLAEQPAPTPRPRAQSTLAYLAPPSSRSRQSSRSHPPPAAAAAPVAKVMPDGCRQAGTTPARAHSSRNSSICSKAAQ